MNRTRGRGLLIGLVVLCALPGMTAWALRDGLGWRGPGNTAAGDLVAPPQDLPDTPLAPRDGGSVARSEAVFSGHWTFLQIAPMRCGHACDRSLRAARQVRALLHVDAARVQRVLLLGDNVPAPVLQPDVVVYRTNVLDWQRLFMAQAAGVPGTIYLIDPAGRWMAFYPPSIGTGALHHDITRLLAVAGGP